MVQSKISLILDGGEPRIKMTCVDSEEIVDTVFKMFAEKFGHISTLCQVEFAYTADPILFITPVTPDKLAETCSKILEAQPRAEKFTVSPTSGIAGCTGEQLTEMAKPEPIRYPGPNGEVHERPYGL